MEKTEIENEIKKIMIILKELNMKNDNSSTLYAPLLWRLSCLKSNNPTPLPLIKLQYHDVNIDIDIDIDK